MTLAQVPAPGQSGSHTGDVVLPGSRLLLRISLSILAGRPGAYLAQHSGQTQLSWVFASSKTIVGHCSLHFYNNRFCFVSRETEVTEAQGELLSELMGEEMFAHIAKVPFATRPRWQSFQELPPWAVSAWYLEEKGPGSG